MARPESDVRPSQTDAEFVAECRLPDVPFAASLALAVRHEIARRAHVAPEQIRASDRLPEEWGDVFFRKDPDVIEFVLELEEQFGISIPDRATLVFVRESVSVADLASELAHSATAARRWWRWW